MTPPPATAAVSVQRLVRGHFGRRRARVARFLREHKLAYLAEARASVRLQCCWRAYAARRRAAARRQRVMPPEVRRRTRRAGKAPERALSGAGQVVRDLPARVVFLRDSGTQTEAEGAPARDGRLLTPARFREGAEGAALLWRCPSPSGFAGFAADSPVPRATRAPRRARAKVRARARLEQQLLPAIDGPIPDPLRRAVDGIVQRREEERKRDEEERGPDFALYAKLQREAHPILLQPRVKQQLATLKAHKQRRRQQQATIRSVHSDPIIFASVNQ